MTVRCTPSGLGSAGGVGGAGGAGSVVGVASRPLNSMRVGVAAACSAAAGCKLTGCWGAGVWAGATALATGVAGGVAGGLAGGVAVVAAVCASTGLAAPTEQADRLQATQNRPRASIKREVRMVGPLIAGMVTRGQLIHPTLGGRYMLQSLSANYFSFEVCFALSD